MADIRLIVGLGNPGPEYENTRHNAGEWFLNQLADTFHTPLKAESKFFGKTARVTIAGQDVRLLYPTTFMNKSGQAVAALANFYRIEPEQILVAFDELDLPPGVAKYKVGGSSSQNGIKDIVAKSTGSSNPHNMIKATFDAFKRSESPKQIASKRSKKINEIIKSREDN